MECRPTPHFVIYYKNVNKLDLKINVYIGDLRQNIYQAPHIHENNQVCLNQLRKKSSIFSFFLFKRADTLSRKKKLSGKPT